MARSIQVGFRRVQGTLAPAGSPESNATVVRVPDDYLGRLLKYIPAELVALYLAAKGVVPANLADSNSTLWIIVVITWLLVPIYMYVVTTKDGGSPLKWQIFLASIAFPVWVFAVGGTPVTGISWYAAHQFVGSLVLMFVTVIFGMKKP
jgi:hypothetical protein